MSTLKHNELVAISSKYGIDMCNISEYLINGSICTAFCDTVKFLVCVLIFVVLYVFGSFMFLIVF